jgi:DNA repair protein RadC
MYPLIADLPNEEFWVLHLNKANRVIDKERISIGGIGGTVVDIKIILKSALLKLSSGLILVHNHPSGNLVPSDADLSITKKLKEGAAMLEILVLDHVIIGDKNYYSFADSGNI